MNEQILLQKMLAKIDLIPQMRGCSVGYYGNNYSKMLRVAVSNTTTDAAESNKDSVGIIIERSEISDPLVINNLQQWSESPGGSSENAPNPIAVDRSKLVPELVGLGLSCGLVAVSAVGLVGGAAGEIPSAGLSSFIVAASWVGFTASAAQCMNAVGRVGANVIGGDETLTEWDNNNVYKNVTFLVDYVGVNTSLVSFSGAARDLWLMARMDETLAVKGLSFYTFKTLPKPKQVLIAQSALEDLAKTPRGRALLLKQAREVTASVFVMPPPRVKVINPAAIKQIADSISDLLTSAGTVAASSTESKYTGSASGSVNWLIHLIETKQTK